MDRDGNPESMKSNRITPAAGIAIGGGIFLAAGILLSASDFSGFSGEPYSITNHFISELGWKRVSPSAAFFNVGLVICCLAYLPMMWTLGREIGTRPGYVAMVSGIMMLGAGVAVGLLPIDDLKPHLIAAAAFFWSFLVTAILFSFAFLPRWNRVPSGKMVTAGVIASLCLVSFLVFPKESAVRFIADPASFLRPDFWWLVILEWSVLFSVYLWGLTAIFVLWSRERAKGGQG